MSSKTLCIDCRHYKAEAREHQDLCLHDKAQCGGVRAIQHYTCTAMRAGICGKNADLFELARTCECGATIAADETHCAGCAADYRREEAQHLDRLFPRREA